MDYWGMQSPFGSTRLKEVCKKGLMSKLRTVMMLIIKEECSDSTEFRKVYRLYRFTTYQIYLTQKGLNDVDARYKAYSVCLPLVK